MSEEIKLERESVEASRLGELLDSRETPKRGVCFLGFKGKCTNPDCPHTLNETDECERCGSEFVFAKNKT